MNCQRIQDECHLEALHDAALLPDIAEAVRAHLATCAACRAQLTALETITAQLGRLPLPATPTQRMRASFHAMLAMEKRALQSGATSLPAGSLTPTPTSTPALTHTPAASLPVPPRVIRMSPAASRIDRFFARLFPRRPVFQFGVSLALLALGLFVGARYLAPSPTQPATATTTPTTAASTTTPQNSKPPPPNATLAATATPAAAAATAAELAELREQMNNMGRLVTYSLLQQKSTGERLQSVLATLQLKSPDRQLLTDLVGTLAFDPSVNVRLSAVDALAPHTGEDLVRAGLIAALPRETAPLVQIAMIELLASARDTEAAPVFARLMADDRADPAVRETARRALAVLNTPNPAATTTAPAMPDPAADTFSHTSTTTKTTT